VTRPIYETAADLEVENGIARHLKAEYGLDCRKLPVSYRIDWAVFKGKKLVGFMELKARKVTKTKYPTLILSLSKLMAGCELASKTSTIFWLGVKWLDTFGVCRITPPFRNVEMGGRTDRNDAADIEPVVHVPVERFKELVRQ
tara:strand:+ start:1141 stop:1569 length:429 start_codon:yes stop_codon:yes gene_type:complete